MQSYKTVDTKVVFTRRLFHTVNNNFKLMDARNAKEANNSAASWKFSISGPKNMNGRKKNSNC
jgi:hypothetical protein